MLKLSDCNVPPLTIDDFAEEAGIPPDQQTYPYSLEEIKFYIQEVRLCEMLGSVFTRQYCLYRLPSPTGTNPPEQDIVDDEHDQRLEAWFSNVVPELYYDVDDIQKHRFLPAVLHIIFL